VKLHEAAYILVASGSAMIVLYIVTKNTDVKVALRPTLKEANEYLKKQLIFQICTYVMS
jgi:hypothetical protein